MTKKILSSGAEAVIYLENNKITKQRTKAETKILKKAGEIINVPLPEDQKEIDKIIMPFIDGLKLSDNLDSFEEKEQEKIMVELGKTVAKLHKENIIHGDLTTSNMIYVKEKSEINDSSSGRAGNTEHLGDGGGKIFIIDFGLGYFNGKYEDKGVDLHLLKQALEAKHFKNWKTLFKEFEVGYLSIEPKEGQKVIDKLKAIEKRGRYKH
jgi:tRNA A-37 threonylcarbamoyl transferase component Bud32